MTIQKTLCYALTSFFLFSVCSALLAAQLSALDMGVLKQAAISNDAEKRGDREFSVETYNKGHSLASNLGRAGDLDALQFIAELRSENIMHAFANGFGNDFKGGSSPQLEEFIIKYRRDPVIGNAVIRLTKQNTSQPLFLALLSDLAFPAESFERPPVSREWNARHDRAYAMLKCDVPGMEPKLIEYLGDAQLTLIIADFLANKHYLPSEPYTFALLSKMPASDPSLGSLLKSAVKLGTQRMYDLASSRLVEIGEIPNNRFPENSFSNLVQAIQNGTPGLTLVPAIRDERNLAKFAPKHREAIEYAIKRRDEKAKWAAEVTSNHFLNWINAGDFEMVRNFITRGVPLDGQDDSGETPLTRTAKNQQWDLTAVLLKAGANPNLRNKEGDPPVAIIAAQTAYAPPNPRQLELIKIMAASGAQVSAPGQHKRTALHNAVISGNLAMVKVLIENKAHINAQCPDRFQNSSGGVTPLQLAIDLKHKEIEVYLRQKGATVSWATLAQRKANSALASIIGPFLVSH